MRVLAVAAGVGVTLVLAGSPDAKRFVLHEVADAGPLPAGATSTLVSGPAGPYSGPAPEVAPAALSSVVQFYCQGCHNDVALTGNLSLQGFDPTAAGETRESAETGEKMIRKLRAGMMPPPGFPRPEGDTLLALVETLERVLDRAAQRNPNPGARPFQRLNRPEYEAAIRNLLGLQVEAGDWLPLDTKSANFDNIADAWALSPTLLEAYLNAASEISRMAVGDRNASALKRTYTNTDYVSQHPWDRVEGAPYGTRGGMVVNHAFPADAHYVFELTFSARGNTRLEDIDVSIDGERVALLHYEPGVGATTTSADGRALGGGFRTEPIFVRAGQRKLSVAFIRQAEGPYEDLIRPHEWALAGGGSGGTGVTMVPHVKDVVVAGPYDAIGISDTPSRQKIFSCRPTVSAEELPCAREIVERLGSEAYRRALTQDEVDGLMAFYELGAETRGFEEGVRTALEAILASPSFYFRLEREPGNARAGRNYELDDVDLASRLSFFLWGTPPDDELLEIARRGRLSDRRTLEQQTRRMLADPRADALGNRFAAQWLRLQDLYKVRPDPNFFPNFDENIADAMHRETELFFANLVREDRSVLDLFLADYTFVNERLARHYGFPNVSGTHFRRVPYPDESRRGLLGQGSVLVLTSLANRTSPVLRGKWVMEVLLGTPPPPPPPGVPDLEETEGAKDGRMLTTRERMEVHRANPTCNACHRFMDPIGLALDNYDVTGKWRNRENGMPLDTRGDFYDGTPVSSPSELADVLLKRPIPLVRTFTENLMTYALGRRLEYYDQPAVRAIAKEAEGNDYRMSSFILGVVKSDAFRMRRAEVAVAEEDRRQQ